MSGCRIQSLTRRCPLSSVHPCRGPNRKARGEREQRYVAYLFFYSFMISELQFY